MTRGRLRLALVTGGSPDELTGGYLYHVRMAERAEANHATLVALALPRGNRSRRAPGLLRTAARTGVDAFVVDSLVAAELAWTAVRWRGVPFIGMLHQPPGGIDAPAPLRLVRAGLDRVTYRRCRSLLAASDSLRQDLLERGYPANRVVVVAPGRDLGAAITRGDPARLRRGRRLAILAVGNWMPRKDIAALLEALATLPHDDATLHLVGRTDLVPAYSRQIQARIEESDLRDRVVVHGPRPRAEVARLYSSADAFVLASRVEPYGTVYGEAMAYGLPVVGWRAGNLPWLATDGVEGLLLTPGDVPGLAAAIHRLAVDEAFRHRLAAGARRRGATLPTWDQTAHAFYAAIRDALGVPVD